MASEFRRNRSPRGEDGTDRTVKGYSCTRWGAILTETTGSLTISFTYDEAGNVLSTTSTGAASSGALVNGPALSTTTNEDWDAQGRVRKYVDQMNRTTTYSYVPSSTGTTVTTTNPDGTTEIDAYYLDGTPESVSGTAVTANWRRESNRGPGREGFERVARAENGATATGRLLGYV